MNLTPSQQRLSDWLKARNTMMEAEANGNFVLLPIDDIQFWMERGVNSIEELKAWEAETERQEAIKEERKAYHAIDARADLANERCYGMID